MKTRIHVNQQRIRQNLKHGQDEPVITAKNYKFNRYAKRVDIVCGCGEVAASVIQSTDKPLSCGARVWVETEKEIKI